MICRHCGGSGSWWMQGEYVSCFTCGGAGLLGLRNSPFGPVEIIIKMPKSLVLPGAHPFSMADVEGKLLAHLVVEIGLFSSVSQARKNGWDIPCSIGTHKRGKTTIVIT